MRWSFMTWSKEWPRALACSTYRVRQIWRRGVIWTSTVRTAMRPTRKRMGLGRKSKRNPVHVQPVQEFRGEDTRRTEDTTTRTHGRSRLPLVRETAGQVATTKRMTPMQWPPSCVTLCFAR
ncbi:unnamed protein product [Ectocarpus sp. 13 AM-2016]